MARYTPLAERLERLSIKEPNSGCWLWTGCIDRCGYAKIGRSRDDPGESLGHRAAFKLVFGPVPDGCEIDHKCRTRCCVNPHHLRAIPHKKNVQLSVYKNGRPNSNKTHCKHGHEFTEANTHVETWRGIRMRKCRACRRRRQETIRLLKAVKALDTAEAFH